MLDIISNKYLFLKKISNKNLQHFTWSHMVPVLTFFLFALVLSTISLWDLSSTTLKLNIQNLLFVCTTRWVSYGNICFDLHLGCAPERSRRLSLKERKEKALENDGLPTSFTCSIRGEMERDRRGGEGRSVYFWRNLSPSIRGIGFTVRRRKPLFLFLAVRSPFSMDTGSRAQR